MRLPNVIDCDIEPFDDKQYIPSSTSSSIDNYIRWRAHYESATDETFKESNTKLVYWKDGTKSLIIGNDCYDIDQQTLNGDRDYIYYNIQDENQQMYKLAHSKINKRLNVRTTTQKSYKTLQKNLAKKHVRTKGSKQLTALQRRNNRNKQNQYQQQYNSNSNSRKRTISKKRSMKESFLEEGGHGNNSSDEDYEDESPRKRQKRSSESSSSSNESDNNDDDDEDDSDSDSDDDDKPIGERLN